MRVQLTTPSAELSFDLSTVAAETLIKTAFRLSNTSKPSPREGQAQNTAGDMPVLNTSESEVPAAQSQADAGPDAGQPPHEDVATFPTERPEERTRYRGFMLIKCGHCGHRKAFNVNSPIEIFCCEKCRQYTQLKGLAPVLAECECGKRWRYMTNENADLLEINCLACGSPISLSFDAHKKAYTTIRRQG